MWVLAALFVSRLIALNYILAHRSGPRSMLVDQLGRSERLMTARELSAILAMSPRRSTATPNEKESHWEPDGPALGNGVLTITTATIRPTRSSPAAEVTACMAHALPPYATA